MRGVIGVWLPAKGTALIVPEPDAEWADAPMPQDCAQARSATG